MRILLVDGHALFRHGLHLILGELGQPIEILEVDQLESALRSAPVGIDMVLLEPRGGEPGEGAGNLHGIDAVRAARERFPKALTVVVSSSEEPAFVMEVFEQGAVGFIPKSSTPEVLLSALRLIRVGGVYVPRLVLDLRRQGGGAPGALSPPGTPALPPVGVPVGVAWAATSTPATEIAGLTPASSDQPAPQSGIGHPAGPASFDAQHPAEIAPPQGEDPDGQRWSDPGHGLRALPQPVGPSAPVTPELWAPSRPTASPAELTARQRQVLTLLVQGLSNKAIARHLDVSESTVKQHLSTSFRLLGVSNRTQAVYRSAELGLTPVGRQS